MEVIRDGPCTRGGDHLSLRLGVHDEGVVVVVCTSPLAVLTVERALSTHMPKAKIYKFEAGL